MNNNQITHKEVQKQIRKIFITKLKFLVFAGLLMFGFAGYIAYSETYIYGRWIEVEAKVIDISTYTKSIKNESEPYFDIKVQYDFSGKTNEVVKYGYSGYPKFKIGDFLKIQINPENYNDSRIVIGSAMQLIYTSLFSGCFLIFIGSFGFIKRKPKAVDYFDQ